MKNKLVEDFEEAVRQHAFRGTYSERQDQVELIDKEYEQTKLKLLEALKRRQQ